jgi:MYXO-CTERM domain-containing protein
MKLPAFLATVIFASTAFTSHASLITWGAPTTISNDSDATTAGTRVGAFNVGSFGVASTTINGTTFDPLIANGTSVTLGNFNLTASGGLGGTNFAGAPAGTSPSYAALVGSQMFTFSNSNAILTMSGLVTGDTYLFQWWSNASATAAPSLTTATGDGGGAVTLSNKAVGTSGQFVIGSFIADATGTQAITFSGARQLNGFQLRNVTPAAVPEAGTTLAGVMMLGLLGARRRRAR